MNLEELQIKIGIELKELNKQLKKASDDINEYLGPKATKKLMADNNKIIKDGFKDMEKTASASAKKMRKEVTKEFEAMSKDINKSLNKAFELDTKKFNSNLNNAMNQAKNTVKSACNDIRRELNNALNIRADVRVNASASSSRNTASRTSDASAIMQSSQYTGAMITKAVNEMIKANNANATRLDASIRHIESALKSEFTKLASKMQAVREKSSSEHELAVKTIVETTIKVVDDNLQSEVNKAINNLNVSDIKTSLVLDEDLQNDADKAVREVITKDIETSIKVDDGDLQDEVDRAIRYVDVPELEAIIELDEDLQNDVNRAIREVSVPDFRTAIKLSESNQIELQSEINNLISKVDVPNLIASFKVDDSALQSKVNESIEGVKEPDIAQGTSSANSEMADLLKEQIASLDIKDVLGMNSSYIDEMMKSLEAIPKLMAPENDSSLLPVLTEAQKRFNDIKETMKGVSLQEVLGKTSFDLTEWEALEELTNYLDNIDSMVPKAKVIMHKLTKAVNELGFESIDAFNKFNKLMGIDPLAGNKKQKPQRPDGFVPKQGIPGQVTKPQRPDGYNPTPGVENTLSSEIIDVDAIKSVTSKAIKEFDDIRSELESLDFKVIEESLIDIGDYVEPLKKQLEPVTKELLKVEAIDDEKISLNLDASDAKEQLRIIHEMYEDLIEACKTNNLNELKKALGISEQSEQPKQNKGPAKPPRPKFNHSPDRKRFNSPRPPEDYLSITIDDDSDKFIEHMKKVKEEIENDPIQIGFDTEEVLEAFRKLRTDKDAKPLADLLSKHQKQEEEARTPAPNSGLPMVIDTTVDDKFDGIRKDIEDAYSKLQTFNKAIAELFQLLQNKADITEGAIKDLFESAILRKNIPIDTRLQIGEYDTRTLQNGIEQTIDSYNKLKKAAGMPTKDITIGIDLQHKKAIEEFEKEFRQKMEKEIPKLVRMDGSEFRDAISGKGFSFEDIAAQLRLVKKHFEEVLDDTDSLLSKDDARFYKKALKNVERLQSKLEKLQNEDIEFNTKLDDLGLNLDLDGLLEKIKSIQSIDDIDIDLDDLRQDLIKLLEQADKLRDEVDDEIKITVINDEIVKAIALLKQLDDVRSRFRNVPDGLGGSGSGDGGNGPRLPGSGNFTTGGSNGPTPTDTGRQFDSHVAIHKAVKAYEQIKEKLNEIKDEYKKMANTISKIANKFTAPFKKMLSGLKGVVSGTKSMWSKITGIFKKGAKDCEKATSGLSLKLKDLLKTALSFVSIYGLINIGKQAIVQSGELAQSEAKLAALMKQRMGATNDTIKAVKQLASEQAKLGVVSEAAMVKGAEQLSMYVHSAKALETLMPAIANMTARRGGFNATPEDAEEIATQLGEAIREGTTTPLEQSGIYLSEAEIKKFQALRTEEERANFLAAQIAKNVGNINEALANTPHGQIAQLKNNFKSLLGTLGTLLVNVIQPIVQWLNVIVVAANNALKALGELLGFDMSGGGLTGIGDVGAGTAPDTGGIDDVGDSLDDAKDSAEEAEKAVEKFKGSLMGFDEINILSDNTNKDTGSEEDDPTNITPGEGGQLTPGFDPTTITEGENIFTKFGEKIKAFMDEVLEPFKAAWDLLGERWKKAWADLLVSFKNFCDSLASFLKSVWDNGGKEFVQHMAEIALAVGIAAAEIGGTILDALAKLWDHLDPEKNMHTQRLLDVLNEVSQKLRDFILGLNEHLENLLKYGGQDVLNAMGDCFMDLAAAAVNAFGVIIDAIDGLIDHLDPKFNENTRNMLQALADMFHAVGEAAWDFSELLRSALENGGQDMINAFGDMLMNLGQATAEVITTMMESFSKFFEYIDPATNDITRNMMKAWEEAFLAIGQAALGFSELFDSIMNNGGQEVLNKLGDAFNSLVGLVGIAVKEIADALNGLFEHLDPKTNEFTQGMLKAWQDAFDGISGMAKDIGEVLSSVMDNGGQDIVNAIGDLGMQILETFGNVVEEVADCVGSLFKHLDPAENKIAKGALDSFEYFINSIRDFVGMLGDALGTFMDNGGQEFVNNMGDIIALLVDLGLTITADLINAVTTFMDSWLGHAVISACATALELISDVLKGLLEILEPLSPIISGVVAAIGGFVVAQKVVGFISSIVSVFQTIAGSGGILALVKGGFTALWAVLSANPIAAIVAAVVGLGAALVALYNKSEGFREFADKVLAGFKDLFDKMKEHISAFLEDVRNIFGNVIDIITGIFEGDGEKVGEAVRNLILNLVDLMMDMNKAFVEVGWALIKGLVQGIWECIKALPSLLAGFLEFVVDFFKGLFGIHSPSTVFAELGVNLIEGLVKGILDSINSVTEAFKKIGDAIFGTIKDIAKTVSDKFKEIKDGIKDRLKETKEVVSEKWKEIKETVSEKVKATYEVAKENWANIKDTVSEKSKEAYNAIKENWKEVKQTATDIFTETYNVTKEKWADIKDTVKERAKETYEAAKDNWTNLKQNTTDRFKDIYDTVKDKFTNIRDTVKEKATKTFEDVSASWTKIKDDAATKLEQIKTDAEKRYNDVKNVLVNKIEEAKKGIIEKWEEVKNKTNECIENVRQTSEEKYNEIKETIVERLEDIKSNTEKKWEEIKKNTGTAVENIKKEAETQYAKIKDSLVDTLEKTKSAMATKWDSIKSDAVSKVSAMANEASNKFAEIKTKLSSKLDEVKSTLSSKWESIKTQTSNAASKISTSAATAFDGISSKASKALDSARTSVSNGLSKITSLFKNTSWSLPKIKLPHFKISGSFSLNPPKVPSFSVEWYKRGGIIDGITPLGMTGGTMHMAGEAGKEMVVPLENTSFTSKIAQAIGQAVDNTLARNYNNMNNNNNSTNENRDVVLQLDGREFARASINQINKLQRESGRTLLQI